MISRLLAKQPILRYILTGFGSFFLWVMGCGIVLFGILFFTGIYRKIETLLDLKYNSPFVLVPLFGCIGLAILSFIVGALLYFHKYKRNKIKSVFSKQLGKVLNDK